MDLFSLGLEIIAILLTTIYLATLLFGGAQPSTEKEQPLSLTKRSLLNQRVAPRIPARG